MNAIKQLRKQLGLNVSELSRITNVSRFTIYRLESGKNANLATTKKVLGYLLETRIERMENDIKSYSFFKIIGLLKEEVENLKTQHQNLMGI
jgi:predicted transcriptional regulator